LARRTLQFSDLIYQGCFTLPLTSNEYNGTPTGQAPLRPTSWNGNWGSRLGRGFAYSPERGTIYLTVGTSGVEHILVAEIDPAVPINSTSKTPGTYNRATIHGVGLPREILIGTSFEAVCTGLGLNNIRERGLCVIPKSLYGGGSGEALLVTLEQWYAGGTGTGNLPTAFIIDLPHNTNLNHIGPFRADDGLTDSTAGGQTTFLPWQDARLGNKQLWYGMSRSQKSGSTSHGPALVGFNLTTPPPSADSTLAAVVASDFRASGVGPGLTSGHEFPPYPEQIPSWVDGYTYGFVFLPNWGAKCFVYDDNVEGMLHFCDYGSVQLYCNPDPQASDACPTPPPGISICYSKGYQSAPSKPLLMIWSLDEMGAVVSGAKQRWEARPTDHMILNETNWPGLGRKFWWDAHCQQMCAGITFDPIGKRVFLQENFAYVSGGPSHSVIHVFSLNTGAAPPPPPPPPPPPTPGTSKYVFLSR